MNSISSVFNQLTETLISRTKKITPSGPSTVADEVPIRPESSSKDLETQIRHVSASGAWMFWAIGALVVILGYGLYKVSNILFLIITGFIVSLALERFVQFWQRHGRSRGKALFISYFILVIFMLSGMMIMVPFVATQLASLLQIGFDSISSLQQQIQTEGLVAVIQSSNWPAFIKSRMTEQKSSVDIIQSVINDNMSQIVSVGGEGLKSAGSFAIRAVDSVVSMIFQAALVATIAVFFSIERQEVFTFIATYTNQPDRTYRTLQQLSMKLGSWLEGQLLLCLIIFCCVLIGLGLISFFGVSLPNKFSLALMAGLTEFLPYIGPILGAIPALLVAGLGFGRKGILVTGILYRLIQMAENNLIVPTIMSQKLGVSPLVIFLCMLIGGSLFGFLGVLLSVPLAVIVGIGVETRAKFDEPIVPAAKKGKTS